MFFFSSLFGKFDHIMHVNNFSPLCLFSYQKMHCVVLNAYHGLILILSICTQKHTRPDTEFIHSIVPYSFPIHICICGFVVVCCWNCLFCYFFWLGNEVLLNFTVLVRLKVHETLASHSMHFVLMSSQNLESSFQKRIKKKRMLKKVYRYITVI